MSIQIERVQTLQQLNWRSNERVVEVSLKGVPCNPPNSDRRKALVAVLESLPRPPSHDEWFQQLATDLCSNATHDQCIAALAVYLQRHLARHNGKAWVDQQSDSLAVVALECLEFEVGLACLRSATNLVDTIGLSGRLQVMQEFSQLQAAHDEYSFGAVTGPIVTAAKRLELPVFRLDYDGLVQLGQGRHQRRIRRSCTDGTSYVADFVSTDKCLVKKLWRQMGIPVPHGREVFNSTDAIQAAREMGWPVVVKPCDGDCGQGVRVNLMCESSVEQAFHQASAGETRVMVERHLAGKSFRFLIIDEKVVSAVCRLPALVVGDGEHCVRELLEISNLQANRGPDRRWHLIQIPIHEVDLDMLREQGFDLESVPVRDQTVWLRRDLDYSSTIEVLDQVHPSTLSLAIDAASVIGLDVAGIDLVATDIGRPLEEQNGGFLEINSYPGIALHLAPICDKPRPVGESILSMLFPEDRSARVPCVLVVGDVADHQVLQSLFMSFYGEPGPIAVSTRTRTQLGDRLLLPPSPSLAHRINVAMMHARTAGAVVTATWEELIENGVGLDFFNVIVLMNSGQAAMQDSPWSMEKAKWMTNRLRDHCQQMIVNVHDPIWKASIEANAQLVSMLVDSGQLTCADAHAEKGGRVWALPGNAGYLTPSRNHSLPADESRQRLWTRLMGIRQPCNLVPVNV